MSLICVRDYEELCEYGWRDTVQPMAVRDCYEIQKAFCDRIEWEQKENDWRRRETEPEEEPEFRFLESKEIQDYLGSYGVKYVGNFLLESTWDSRGDERSKEETETMKSREFVTWLNYPLQLACIALSTDNLIYIDESATIFLDARYLKPVVKKRDLICKVNARDIDLIIEFVKAGCDVIMNHESVTERFKNRDESELWSYLENRFPKYITRELDSKVLDENMIKSFAAFTPRRILLSELEKEYPGSEYPCFLEEHPEIAKAVYIENAKPVFSGFRRPPLYLLWLIDGDWYFLHKNSFKYPTYVDLVLQAAFSPEEFACRYDDPIDAASVEKVFALVLDVDEICDASKYWESIAFYLKYDRRKNEIEICEKNSAIIEFHNLLQESRDFEG